MVVKYFPILLFTILFSVYSKASEIDNKRLDAIDKVVTKAIENRQTPGAVVLVGHKDKIVYRKAFGYTSTAQSEPMSPETIFDLASLTKVFTATAIILLAEQGLVRINAPVSTYIPEFAQNGKDKITIEQLLLHTSGLPAANHLDDYKEGCATALDKIYAIKVEQALGTKFVYSDVGYIVLGEVIKRVSNKRLDEFMHDSIIKPIGMKNTCFLPPESIKHMIAPTEERDTRLLQGEVHDPRAFLLGGFAGHAGLFSTGDDLTLFCKMILNYGALQSGKLLSTLGITRMLKPHDVGDNKLRGLGWDIKTEYSTCLGDFFQVGTIAHTGFTGTSLVIKPSLKVFIIILTNRVHLKGASVVDLRASIANIVASSLNITSSL